MKVDAVFEGGGVKGIAFVGAICSLEEHGYSFNRLAGTSAGSIIASLLAAGYTGKELKKIMSEVDYSRFLDKKMLKSPLLLGNLFKFVKNKGLYSGDPIEKFVSDLLIKKGKTKFKDVSNNGQSTLKIIASDITNKRMLILPDDISKYGIDPMEFSIATAVRMSIGIPLYFKPVKLNYKNNLSYIVDGGILSNYPVWIFDSDKAPRWPTFGFKLVEPRLSYTSEGKNDIISYILDVISTVIDGNELNHIKTSDFVRTIPIKTLGVKSTEFKISADKSTKLFQSGYDSGKKFIRNFDFNNYVKVYRTTYNKNAAI